MATLELVYVDGSSDTAETKDLAGLRRMLADILRTPSCTEGLLRYELRNGAEVLASGSFVGGLPPLTPIAAAIGAQK